MNSALNERNTETLSFTNWYAYTIHTLWIFWYWQLVTRTTFCHKKIPAPVIPRKIQPNERTLKKARQTKTIRVHLLTLTCHWPLTILGFTSPSASWLSDLGPLRCFTLVLLYNFSVLCVTSRIIKHKIYKWFCRHVRSDCHVSNISHQPITDQQSRW